MQLSGVDWFVIVVYFVFVVAVGLAYRGRAGKGIEEFFVSGRSIPWPLAGVSMVATTFAADTPLAVTGMTATNGIAGNWLWWNFLFSGLLTAFLFARLWRRAEVLTDAEFAEIRYSGRPAAFLRGFRALYLALPVNCIVIGWVNLAMVKILTLTLGLEKFEAILVALGMTALISVVSALSGLRGVLVTDFVQFFLMMAMAVALAYYAVDAVGGLAGLKSQVIAQAGSDQPLHFFPDLDSPWMPLEAFLVYIAVIWWATWYPGAEPGGGGFTAQRIFASKTERDGLLATLLFNVAHFAFRPWPWILVALASMVLYPELDDPETGYVVVMIEHLPPALRGLMAAGFAAAYMSTVSTNLNWGAGYLVSDVYRRFLRPKAGDRELVSCSRWATVLLAVAASVVTFYMESVAGAWRLLLAVGAGTGAVLILRWLWWRINAWSEVAAMAGALVITLILQYGYDLNADDPRQFAVMMYVTVGAVTAIWLAVTLLTLPEPMEKLEEFYRRVRPYPLLWGPVAKRLPEIKASRGLSRDLLAWAAGCAMIYGALFGVGKALLLEPLSAGIWLTVALAAMVVVARCLRPEAEPTS